MTPAAHFITGAVLAAASVFSAAVSVWIVYLGYPLFFICPLLVAVGFGYLSYMDFKSMKK